MVQVAEELIEEQQTEIASDHNDNGFCGNMAHECHQQSALINQLTGQVQAGLASAEDASRIYQGKTV